MRISLRFHKLLTLTYINLHNPQRESSSTTDFQEEYTEELNFQSNDIAEQ